MNARANSAGETRRPSRGHRFFIRRGNHSCWVHPCPSHKTWVIGNEKVRHPEDCKKSYRWKPTTVRVFFMLGYESPGDAAYLTRIDRELQREGFGSPFLPTEEPDDA